MDKIPVTRYLGRLDDLTPSGFIADGAASIAIPKKSSGSVLVGRAHCAVRTVSRTKSCTVLIVTIHAESLSRLMDHPVVSRNLRPREVNLLPR